MTVQEDFASAQVQVKQLPKTPSAPELLELYALYKQATAGDAQGSRPGMLDVRGRAKYDAWSKRQGMTQEDAMQAYVACVNTLRAKYAGA